MLLANESATDLSAAVTSPPRKPTFSMAPQKSPLFAAAQRGKLKSVQTLLAQGYDVNEQDAEGMPWNVTPLMLAAGCGHTDVVQALLSAGANVRMRDKSVPGEAGDATALHYAAANGNVDTIRALVAAKADVNARSKRYASTPLALAVQCGHLAAAQLLLGHGADPARAARHSANALQIAIEAGHHEFVKLFLKDAPPSLINSQGICERTPLVDAIWAKDLEVASLLVSLGADVNFRNSEGTSPLMIAVIQESKLLVALLLTSGADVRNTDKSGQSAWDIAQRDRLPVIAKMLEKHGAKANGRGRPQACGPGRSAT